MKASKLTKNLRNRIQLLVCERYRNDDGEVLEKWQDSDHLWADIEIVARKLEDMYENFLSSKAKIIYQITVRKFDPSSYKLFNCKRFKWDGRLFVVLGPWLENGKWLETQATEIIERT